LTQLKQALHNNIQSSVVQPSVSNFAGYLLDFMTPLAKSSTMTPFDDEYAHFSVAAPCGKPQISRSAGYGCELHIHL
jgi:hypothetical protein